MGLSGFESDIVSASIAGLLVLAVQKGWDTTALRQRGGGGEGPRIVHNSALSSANGRDSAAIAQNGTGNTAHVDNSRHSTTNNTYGGPATAGQGDPWEEILAVALGGLLLAALVTLGFAWSENTLRVVYAGVWGATLASGLVTATKGQREGMSAGWQVAVSLPWIVVCAAAAHLWGRWTGRWGAPLPKLQELTEAVRSLPGERGGSWLDQVVSRFSGTAGLLLNPTSQMMPGALSVLAVLAMLGMLVVALVLNVQAMLAAHLTGGGRLWEWVAKRVGHLVEQPWKAGAGMAGAFLAACLGLWFATSPWVAQAISGTN